LRNSLDISDYNDDEKVKKVINEENLHKCLNLLKNYRPSFASLKRISEYSGENDLTEYNRDSHVYNL